MSKRVFYIFFCIFFVSCTPRGSSAPDINTTTESSPAAVATNTQAAVKNSEFSKTLREAIYFSNSLEREALKLILKDNSFQKQTLFSVLSYVVETNSGAKKSPPYGLDCGNFIVSREHKTIKIFKTCVKPIAEIARIQIVTEDVLYDIEFLIKEWADVVGLSVSLTGQDLRCQLSVKDKKLHGLKCDNWAYQTETDQISSTVIKAREFLFQRDAEKQFIIKGGFLKELIENKKIDILVPLEGKIKIFEKEIRVIDEFADKINQESRVKHEKEEEYKKEISQEISQEASFKNEQEAHEESKPESADETSSRGGRGR